MNISCALPPNLSPMIDTLLKDDNFPFISMFLTENIFFVHLGILNPTMNLHI